jgi:hypothetical protein
MTPEEIESRIEEIFVQNYEMLKFEGGHALQEHILQSALHQVLYYYKKLQKIAEKVTETEVKLTLPNQKTPDGRPFTIEGIVDIVREDEEVWMYDIKTHDPNYIHSNKSKYERQLNVYSYIFENIRGEQLDHTAIISTALPKSLQTALLEGDEGKIAIEMKSWEPLIDLSYDPAEVRATIDDFAKIVDKIESYCFEPVEISRLKEKISGLKLYFATHVCRNCDARFSCKSYREYSLERNKGSYTNYLKYYQEEENELDDEQYVTENIDIEKINSQVGIEETIEGIERRDEE